MRRGLHIYVYGHLHISLCATVLFMCGYQLAGLETSLASYLFIFTSTLLIYTLHRHLAAQKFEQISSLKRYTFVNKHTRLTWILLVTCLVISGYTFFLLQPTNQFAMIICGILSVGYVLPLIANSRLRDIGVLKIFLISIVWGVLPGLGFLERDGLTTQSLMIMLEHVAFIFALTIPFDIRDRDLDRGAQVSNLANQLGLTTSMAWMVFILLLSVILASINFMIGTYNLEIVGTQVLFYALVLYACYKAQDRDELYYLLYLDGLILLKGAILITGSHYLA